MHRPAEGYLLCGPVTRNAHMMTNPENKTQADKIVEKCRYDALRRALFLVTREENFENST